MIAGSAQHGVPSQAPFDVSMLANFEQGVKFDRVDEELKEEMKRVRREMKLMEGIAEMIEVVWDDALGRFKDVHGPRSERQRIW